MKSFTKLIALVVISLFAYEANAQVIVKRKIVKKTTRVSTASVQPKYSSYNYRVTKNGNTTIIDIKRNEENKGIKPTHRTPEQQQIADAIDAPIKPFAKLKKLGLKNKFKRLKGKLKQEEAEF